MTRQKEYWDKKINEWSYASYNKRSKISVLEKIATYFRSVNKRKDVAVKLIGPLVKNKIILDLGCGFGDFTLDILKYEPKKVIAIDISPVAIKEVKKKVKKLYIKTKIEFSIGDVSELGKLPKFNIAVGLGFIDYLEPQQMKYLFKLLGNKLYLFSYFERKLSFFNLMHKIYTTLQGCPGAYKYTKDEIRQFIPQKSALYFINKEGLWFITNIKI